MVLGDDGSGVERLVDANNVSLNATVFDKCAVPNATLRICGAAGGGVFFPTNPAAEAEWPKGLRIFLYLLAMLWSFAGVGEFADTFMCAIETITSKTKTAVDDEGDQQFVKVWNPTIANLTLMALGSSAPEILLGIIEICFAQKFYAGALGPSTIVGSAAFNLLIIIGVCTISLTNYKRISRHSVYVVTAVFSVFAYLWIVIVTQGISPNVITVGEAIVTVLLFPVLVALAYLIDKDMLLCCITKVTNPSKRASKIGVIIEVDNKKKGGKIIVGHSDKYESWQASNVWNELVEERQHLQNGHDHDADSAPLSESEKDALAERMKEKHATQGQSRAAYRIMAQRKMHGKTTVVDEEELESEIGFGAGPAIQCDDNPLLLPAPPACKDAGSDQGFITFSKEKYEMLEGGNEGTPRNPDTGNAYCHIAVHRNECGSNAPQQKITYSTIGDTATPDKDFISADKVELIFEPGETQKIIKIEIIDDDVFEQDEMFFVQLEDPNEEDGGGSVPVLGGVKQCEVFILNDDDMKTFADRVTAMLSFNKHKFHLGKDQWGSAICEAIMIPDAEEGAMAKINWAFMLPFTLTNALLCPPTTIAGGWATFGVSLALTGVTTAFIGDFASLFGCVVGISDEITAITFVALGTSLPDTFASRTAALNEPDADAAITNVTGSNSVNVFLGLGLTWSIGSIYWAVVDPDSAKLAEWKTRVPLEIVAEYPNGAFYLDAGSLSFSVIIFTCSSLIAFAILHVQRSVPVAYPGEDKNSIEGGELGGPRRHLVGGLFFLLWFMYILLSSLKSEGYLGTDCP